MIFGLDGGPRRIRCRQESLAAEFRIHTVVDIVDPSSEMVRITNNCVGEWLQFQIIVEGCTAVLAGQHVLQKFEPFFDRGPVLYRIGGD